MLGWQNPRGASSSDREMFVAIPVLWWPIPQLYHVILLQMQSYDGFKSLPTRSCFEKHVRTMDILFALISIGLNAPQPLHLLLVNLWLGDSPPLVLPAFLQYLYRWFHGWLDWQPVGKILSFMTQSYNGYAGARFLNILDVLCTFCHLTSLLLQDLSGLTIVYGRYNFSIHEVYKPTNITGGHHPVVYLIISRGALGRCRARSTKSPQWSVGNRSKAPKPPKPWSTWRPPM
jgi:hypothetical protein